jgi:hypothetical protein
MVKLSPLVTTLLLLVISGALGAGVMTWGEEYIEARAEFVERPASCEDTSFGIVTVGGSQTLCYALESLSLFLENSGNTHIDGFRTIVLGATEVVQQDHHGVRADDIDAFRIPYDLQTLGVPQQVRILAKMGQSTCQPGVITEEILPCP